MAGSERTGRPRGDFMNLKKETQMKDLYITRAQAQDFIFVDRRIHAVTPLLN